MELPVGQMKKAEFFLQDMGNHHPMQNGIVHPLQKIAPHKYLLLSVFHRPKLGNKVRQFNDETIRQFENLKMRVEIGNVARVIVPAGIIAKFNSRKGTKFNHYSYKIHFKSFNIIIMTNVDLVKKAYSNFAEGNVEAVLAIFDQSIEWRECKGMPFVKSDGIFIGAEAIVTNVFMNLPVFFDGFNIAVNEVFGNDDKVVMAGFYQGTNKATGNPFKANATHVLDSKKRKTDPLFSGGGYSYN